MHVTDSIVHQLEPYQAFSGAHILTDRKPVLAMRSSYLLPGCSLCCQLDCLAELLSRHGSQAGKLELVSNVEVPRAARKIRATFCPKLHITEPEYIVMGGEDTSVYIYDISQPSQGPVVVSQLQVRLVFVMPPVQQ